MKIIIGYTVALAGSLFMTQSLKAGLFDAVKSITGSETENGPIVYNVTEEQLVEANAKIEDMLGLKISDYVTADVLTALEASGRKTHPMISLFKQPSGMGKPSFAQIMGKGPQLSKVEVWGGGVFARVEENYENSRPVADQALSVFENALGYKGAFEPMQRGQLNAKKSFTLKSRRGQLTFCGTSVGFSSGISGKWEVSGSVFYKDETVLKDGSALWIETKKRLAGKGADDAWNGRMTGYNSKTFDGLFGVRLGEEVTKDFVDRLSLKDVGRGLVFEYVQGQKNSRSQRQRRTGSHRVPTNWDEPILNGIKLPFETYRLFADPGTKKIFMITADTDRYYSGSGVTHSLPDDYEKIGHDIMCRLQDKFGKMSKGNIKQKEVIKANNSPEASLVRATFGAGYKEYDGWKARQEIDFDHSDKHRIVGIYAGKSPRSLEGSGSPYFACCAVDMDLLKAAQSEAEERKIQLTFPRWYELPKRNVRIENPSNAKTASSIDEDSNDL